MTKETLQDWLQAASVSLVLVKEKVVEEVMSPSIFSVPEQVGDDQS